MYSGLTVSGQTYQAKKLITAFVSSLSETLSAKVKPASAAMTPAGTTVIEATQLHERLTCDYEITLTIEGDNTFSIDAWGNRAHVDEPTLFRTLSTLLQNKVIPGTVISHALCCDGPDTLDPQQHPITLL